MHPRERFRERWRSRAQPALISVHRGLWGPAPENSREGIAAGSSFGIVEIDAQIAADGVPVVMHDSSLARMTGDARFVRDLSSVEITELTLLAGDGGNGERRSDETVPTLADAISGAPPDTFFDFDVKHPNEVEAIAGFLAESSFADRGSLKIDVKNKADITLLREWEDRFGIMFMAKPVLTTEALPVIQGLVDAGVAAAEVWFDDLDTLSQACEIAGNDLAISTYTLDPVHCCGLNDAMALKDPDAVWGKLLDAGVSVIMTDKAPALRDYLDSLGT